MGEDRTGQHRPWGAVGWAVLFAALTSVGLAALAWFLVTMDVLVALGLGLVASSDTRFGPGEVPTLDGYGWALVIGIVVNVVGAAAIALLVRRSVARSWPAWVTGLVSAGVAVLVAGSVLLLTLGISPVDVVAGP